MSPKVTKSETAARKTWSSAIIGSRSSQASRPLSTQPTSHLLSLSGDEVYDLFGSLPRAYFKMQTKYLDSGDYLEPGDNGLDIYCIRRPDLPKDAYVKDFSSYVLPKSLVMKFNRATPPVGWCDGYMADILQNVKLFQKPIVLKLKPNFKVDGHFELRGQMRTFDTEEDIHMICVIERKESYHDHRLDYVAVRVYHTSGQTWTWTIEDYKKQLVKVDVIDSSGALYFSGYFHDRDLLLFKTLCVGFDSLHSRNDMMI